MAKAAPTHGGNHRDALIGRALTRGRAMRFILHDEGRVATDRTPAPASASRR